MIKKIIEWSLIPLNSILLFFVIFESQVDLPKWLQVFGRMHPLVLHFPIVLVLLFAALTITSPLKYKKEHWYRTASDTLLLAAAVTSTIAALMGFGLSGSESYDTDALFSHKMTGVAVPFVLHLFYSLKSALFNNINIARISSFAIIILITIAGHRGAVITHGENFIFEPITPENKRIIAPFEDAFVYADLVQPILEVKCMGCHNSNKSKGDLVMDTKELFIKGGKDGIPWDTAKENLGVLMARIHMPMEEKEHMPPKGKPQLSDSEIFILQEWIRRGSNFESRLTDLQPSDTLYVIGKNLLPSTSEDIFDFDAADEDRISELSNVNRNISPVAYGSPALTVSFYNKALFKIAHLEELLSIRENITEINLANMNVKDEDISIISQFKNLRKLNLNYTSITGKTLGQLTKLSSLKILSLSGTDIGKNYLRNLADFPKLRKVYIWNTSTDNQTITSLEGYNKNISWYSGKNLDSVVLQLTPPILDNDQTIISGSLDLRLKHYINDVQLRYTTDGTVPDSLSPLYVSNKIILDTPVTIKAKAFKPGWVSSEAVRFQFFKRKFSPDSVALLTNPQREYKGDGAKTINDNVKSDINERSGKWLGFTENFEALLWFNNAVTASKITISVLEDPSSSIFPATSIEIWGGKDVRNLKLITVHTPRQLTKMEPLIMKSVDINIPATSLNVMKIVAKPPVIPKWRTRSGEPGWFFVDEVFIN